MLESEALYVRKAGEEVTQQLYNFEDKGGRRVALRPEMTPSLARMVMARRGALALPVKWFSIPQCWRYERTTRGRRREHFQWNVDVWGVSGPEAEAELLACVANFLDGVGLTAAAVGIKVSLMTTCFGLIVGIPAFVAFNYFTGIINRFVLDVEESASEMIETVTLQTAISTADTDPGGSNIQ